MTVLGFTGTRNGLTAEQADALLGLLESLKPAECHHGDCVGADARFHQLALDHTRAVVHVHPPADARLRAYCSGPADRVVFYPAKPYLDRNADIVRAAGLLIACPHEAKETGRGGTWWTVRCSRLRCVPRVIVWPDGTLHWEE